MAAAIGKGGGRGTRARGSRREWQRLLLSSESALESLSSLVDWMELTAWQFRQSGAVVRGRGPWTGHRTDYPCRWGPWTSGGAATEEAGCLG